MKCILIILSIMTRFLGYSQTITDTFLSPSHPIDTIHTEIQLNDSIDTLKCGFWENGDYVIYIEILPFSETLLKDYSGLIHSIQNKSKYDSGTLIPYKLYAERYANAIHQLRGTDSGFNLRRLVLYTGQENTERNKGNSAEVELYVRQQLEKGNVAVFYKGQRVYKLKYRMVKDYIMSTIKIYFDDENNSAFNYFGYINW